MISTTKTKKRTEESCAVYVSQALFDKLDAYANNHAVKRVCRAARELCIEGLHRLKNGEKLKIAARGKWQPQPGDRKIAFSLPRAPYRDLVGVAKREGAQLANIERALLSWMLGVAERQPVLALSGGLFSGEAKPEQTPDGEAKGANAALDEVADAVAEPAPEAAATDPWQQIALDPLAFVVKEIARHKGISPRDFCKEAVLAAIAKELQNLPDDAPAAGRAQ